jgi:Transposase DNA-binding/Transposase DDE domain
MTERLENDAIARMVDDLGSADLGDPRRVARAQAVVRRLAAMPDESLPEAMGTDAELEGAYRLFNNARVTFEALFDSHAFGTVERAQGLDVVLAIHDTTPCTFRHADPEEVGYLNTGKPGFPLHLTLLVDTGEWRRPLGLTHAEILPRGKPPRQRGTKHRVPSRVTAKKLDSEFLRWQRGIDVTEARLSGTGTAVIHVADRESDSYALMATCLRENHRFVFRARNNRNTVHDGALVPVWDLIADAEVVLEREVPLSRRIASTVPRRSHQPRKGRVARLCFSKTRVTFRRPHIVGAHMPKTIEVNALHVFERDAPAGQEPVDWLLYTTEPLDTREQIETIVDYYRCRWLIEELNKALKTGCVVQERRLESLDALTTMLALSLPIAVELLALRTLARANPSAPAETVLTKDQLAALRHMSHRPLPKVPTVQDALWCIAGLGGHIKNNGPAGWQVLQRGMEKFLTFAAGWCAAKGVNL